MLSRRSELRDPRNMRNELSTLLLLPLTFFSIISLMTQKFFCACEIEEVIRSKTCPHISPGGFYSIIQNHIAISAAVDCCALDGDGVFSFHFELHHALDNIRCTDAIYHFHLLDKV